MLEEKQQKDLENQRKMLKILEWQEKQREKQK